MDEATEITRRPGTVRSMVGEPWGGPDVDRSWERLEHTVTRARRLRTARGVVLLVALGLAGFVAGRALRGRQHAARDRVHAASTRS